MTTEQAQAPRTKQALYADMKAATDKGDWKAVTKLSQELSKRVASDEKAEVDAKAQAAVALTGEIKAIIDTAVDKLVKEGKLDKMDGIWYVNDFGEKLTTCRLVKTAPRKGGGGGGAAKKFDISTVDLLAKHGSKVANGETGQTFQQAYSSNTDGNSRYNLRVKMLKLESSS